MQHCCNIWTKTHISAPCAPFWPIQSTLELGMHPPDTCLQRQDLAWHSSATVTVPVPQCGTQKWPKFRCFLTKITLFWLPVIRIFQFEDCYVSTYILSSHHTNFSVTGHQLVPVWHPSQTVATLTFSGFFRLFLRSVRPVATQTSDLSKQTAHISSRRVLEASCAISCTYFEQQWPNLYVGLGTVVPQFSPSVRPFPPQETVSCHNRYTSTTQRRITKTGE